MPDQAESVLQVRRVDLVYVVARRGGIRPRAVVRVVMLGATEHKVKNSKSETTAVQVGCGARLSVLTGNSQGARDASATVAPGVAESLSTVKLVSFGAQ